MNNTARRGTPHILAKAGRLLAPALFASGLAFAAAMDNGAAAHNGRIAQDGCHKDNKAEERHWHSEGVKRGGLCVERDGKTVQLTDDGAERPAESKAN